MAKRQTKSDYSPSTADQHASTGAPPYSAPPPRRLRQCLNRKGAPPAAFFGRAVFLCTVPLPLLSVVIRLAQRKPPSSSDFKERSWGKVSWKLLQCITVEAYKVGDYESYFRLTHSAPAAAPKVIPRLISGSGCRSLTCRIQQRKHQPMRWQSLRSPCGTSSPVEWATAEMPGAVSLRPALTPGLRLNPLPPFV